MALPEEGEMFYQYSTAWPCSSILAQSPGMNIIRNPIYGRNFEYYSKDPLLSGIMASAIIRGVQKHKEKGVSIKHFVGNNCELNRNYSSSNMSERTLREIYLRGFEIAVKESSLKTVMVSYNKVNGCHVVNIYDLLAKVLRNEWNFKGVVISDWDSIRADPKNPEILLSGDVKKAHSSQLDLVCPGRKDQIEVLLNGLEKGEVKRGDLERSATRILTLIRKQ